MLAKFLTKVVICSFLLPILFVFSSPRAAHSQMDTIRIATYNILNFPGSTGASRAPHFRTVINTIDPDILVVQELLSQSGQQTFLNDVLNHDSNQYQAAPFINGFDTDNGLFYKQDKVMLLGNQNINTALRDVSEYAFFSGVTEFRIFSFHLKASQGSTNESKRLAEATILRNYLNDLFPTSNFIAAGDYNIYNASEQAFSTLTGNQADNDGRLFDPINQSGNWHNSASYASVHTQSTRTTQFGGGANGGLDDRFDMLLVSQGLLEAGGMDILPDSYTAYGNDASHFNLAINAGSNTSVPDSVVDALHAASDHLPVFADFVIGTTTDVEDYDLPAEFHLSNAYPNPFNPSTTITYSLPFSSHVLIVIYDLLGREVATLVNDVRMAGSEIITWDGIDKTGQSVASGYM